MKPELEFSEVSGDAAAWLPVEGDLTGMLDEVTLASDDAGSIKTRLLRFAPGCDTTPNGVLAHDFWEEIFILSGAIRDLRLDQEFGAGSYACRPPGMPHGPWYSEHGATLFEVRYRSETQ